MIDRFKLLYDDGNTEYLAMNPNLTTEQIDLLYDAGADRISLARFPKLTEKQFMRLFNGGGKKHLAQNPNLTTEQIDLLYKTERVSKNKLAQWSKLTEEQFMRFFKDKDVKNPILSYNSNLTPEQIDFLYDYANDLGGRMRLNPNDDVRRFLVQKSKLTDEQFMRFFNDKDLANTKLAKNPHLTTEQIDLLYQTEGVNKDSLARYPKLTEEQFMRFYFDKDVNKDFLGMNKHITPEQIDLLYQTKGVSKENLSQWPKLTEEQFMRFFNRGTVHLALNPSINPPANQQFASGIFNWGW